MKEYPSISKIINNIPIYAFSKYDGSQIRVEWDRKKGFHRWGRRNGLLDDSNPVLKLAPGLFNDTQAFYLDEEYRRRRWESCVTFVEFVGDMSFAGNHDPADPTLRTVVFDIDIFKHGMLDPKDFINVTSSSGAPNVSQCLYRGNANEQFVKSVRDSTLPGMPLEGVVCKTTGRRPGSPIMFKVKSTAWLDRLKHQCGDDDNMFKMLA